VQAILDGMAWLNLGYDEGPFYQMQRMPRYKEVLQQMLAAGQAYYCYTSPAELVWNVKVPQPFTAVIN
jgi:glutamyl-tRNA synthetase